MTIPEMLWVLERVKECVERREDDNCCRKCKECQCFIEYSTLLGALDSIINVVYRTGERGRRN